MTTLYPSMQFTMIVRLKLSLTYPKLDIAENNLGKIITPSEVGKMFLPKNLTEFKIHLTFYVSSIPSEENFKNVISFYCEQFYHNFVEGYS